jgi:hypothetical protein
MLGPRPSSSQMFNASLARRSITVRLAIVNLPVFGSDQLALRERHQQNGDQLVHDDSVRVPCTLVMLAQAVPNLGYTGDIDNDINRVSETSKVHEVVGGADTACFRECHAGLIVA